MSAETEKSAAAPAPAPMRCQRIGCDAMFTDDDNPDGSCHYHPSVSSLLPPPPTRKNRIVSLLRAPVDHGEVEAFLVTPKLAYLISLWYSYAKDLGVVGSRGLDPLRPRKARIGVAAVS